jgi:predicted XRE-type DNA-binding protein
MSIEIEAILTIVAAGGAVVALCLGLMAWAEQWFDTRPPMHTWEVIEPTQPTPTKRKRGPDKRPRNRVDAEAVLILTERGMTTREIGRVLRISQSSVSRVQRGVQQRAALQQYPLDL